MSAATEFCGVSEAIEAVRATEIRVERGQPTDEELAALVAVLGGLGGGPVEEGAQERNLWGHPVEALRYGISSWARVTLLERTHMRR